VIDEKRAARSKRAQWHKGCVQELYLHSRLEQQFAFVEARDGLRCAWPGCGATPERWFSPDWDRHAIDHGFGNFPDCWPRDLFADVPWSERTVEQRQLGWYKEIERRSALQIDHRVPLWAVADLPDLERRWYFGPGNLWLLCPAHHKAKTKAEAAIRAKVRSGSAQLHLFATSPDKGLAFRS
jgi:hypothetical protein